MKKEEEAKFNICAGNVICPMCDFVARKENGLRIHIGRKHK